MKENDSQCVVGLGFVAVDSQHHHHAEHGYAQRIRIAEHFGRFAGVDMVSWCEEAEIVIINIIIIIITWLWFRSAFRFRSFPYYLLFSAMMRFNSLQTHLQSENHYVSSHKTHNSFVRVTGSVDVCD